MDTIERLLSFFERNGISYERRDHEAVFTCDAASRAVEGLSGHRTKNLFLIARNGTFVLLMVRDDKRVDIKQFAETVGDGRFSFAPEEKLAELLGLTPGAVTPLGLINDVHKRVRLFIDIDIWDGQALQCHPLVNTSTLSIPRDHLARFFALIEHAPAIVAVPARA